MGCERVCACVAARAACPRPSPVGGQRCAVGWRWGIYGKVDPAVAAGCQVIGAEEPLPPPGEENARWPSGAVRGSAAPPPRRVGPAESVEANPAAPEPVPGGGTEPWGSATACARGSSATPAAPSPAPAPPRSPKRRRSLTPPRSRSPSAPRFGPAVSPAGRRTGRRCCCRTAAVTGRPPSGRLCPRPAAPAAPAAGGRRRRGSRRCTSRRRCRDPGRSCAWRRGRRRRRRGKSARASTGRSRSRSGSTSRRTACCCWVRARVCVCAWSSVRVPVRGVCRGGQVPRGAPRQRPLPGFPRFPWAPSIAPLSPRCRPPPRLHPRALPPARFTPPPPRPPSSSPRPSSPLLALAVALQWITRGVLVLRGRAAPPRPPGGSDAVGQPRGLPGKGSPAPGGGAASARSWLS